MKYAYSYNGEQYHGLFETREEALEEAICNADLDDTHVWTAEAVDCELELPFDADDFEERSGELLYDEVGEFAEDFEFGREARQALQTKLEAVWEQWKREYAVGPSCFSVRNVKEHEVPPDLDDVAAELEAQDEATIDCAFGGKAGA